MVVVPKLVSSGACPRALTAEWAEDRAYYEAAPVRRLVGHVYDPEARLPEARSWEAAWSDPEPRLSTRCIIAT